MSLALADFEELDRSILKRLHAELTEVVEMLRPQVGPVDGAALRRRCEGTEWRSLIRLMKVFGQTTYDAKPSPDVRQVMHDLRGGSLAVLLLRIQSVEDELDAAEAERLERLARAHLDLIHSCIPDLARPVITIGGRR